MFSVEQKLYFLLVGSKGNNIEILTKEEFLCGQKNLAHDYDELAIYTLTSRMPILWYGFFLKKTIYPQRVELRLRWCHVALAPLFLVREFLRMWTLFVGRMSFLF